MQRIQASQPRFIPANDLAIVRFDGISWAAGQPADRLTELATVGARMEK